MGGDRSIKKFFEMGYCKNGLKVMNVIHVNDICKILEVVISKAGKEEASQVMGQRFILTCGAFLIRDWAKALGKNDVGEDSSENALVQNKFCSRAKIASLLPSDYEWTLPLAGVQPQTYYEMNGEVKKQDSGDSDQQAKQ